MILMFCNSLNEFTTKATRTYWVLLRNFNINKCSLFVHAKNRSKFNQYCQILSIHRKESCDHSQRHLDQCFVRFLWLTFERAKESSWCDQFFANILKRFVSCAKVEDELSSNRLAYQKSNARSMSIISKTKFWLIIIKWDNDLQMHIIYERIRRKSLFYMSKMSSNSWKLYTSLRKRSFLTNDIACNWLWSCNLRESSTIDFRLCWRFVINTSRWFCCRILTTKSNLECWSWLCFITSKTILRKRMRMFFYSTLYLLSLLFVSSSLTSVTKTNLKFSTSQTSRVCCFVLTSSCSLYFSRIKFSLLSFWLHRNICFVFELSQDKNNCRCRWKRKWRKDFYFDDVKVRLKAYKFLRN